jgi:hypothetical protein
MMSSMSHKFSLAQIVKLAPSGFSNGRPSADGLYEVTRLMPADVGGEYHYRLRSDAGERVAPERDLVADGVDAEV